MFEVMMGDPRSWGDQPELVEAERPVVARRRGGRHALPPHRQRRAVAGLDHRDRHVRDAGERGVDVGLGEHESRQLGELEGGVVGQGHRHSLPAPSRSRAGPGP